MKRIIFFSHSQALGGAELSMLEIISRIDRFRFEPVIMAPGTGPLSMRATNMGVEIMEVALPSNLMEWHRGSRLTIELFYMTLVSVVKLAGWLRAASPGVLYTHSQKAHILGGLAGRLAGLPVVWHLRDFMERPSLQAMETVIGRWLPRRIIVPSRIMMERGSHAGIINKMVLIPNGIDVEAVRFAAGRMGKDLVRKSFEVEPRGPLVGMVGRVAPRKGQHLFILAASAIAYEIPRARFLVIGGPLFGEADYYEQVKRSARDLGLEGRLLFTGHREDVLSLMASLEVIVHCSLEPEPFSRVVAEAMALGVPVVSMSSGGAGGLIEDRVDGLLVPLGNVEALSRAVIELLRQPSLRSRLTRAASDKIETRFRLDRVVAEIEKLLEGI